MHNAKISFVANGPALRAPVSASATMSSADLVAVSLMAWPRTYKIVLSEAPTHRCDALVRFFQVT